MVGNGRFCQLDPYLGTQLNLAESYRKVALSGAKPIAVTNCLNFGSPEDEAVMWQFERSVTGLADATLEMKIPVTGGNVSFYNQTGEVAILPTPVIGVLGTIEDVTKRITNNFQKPNLAIYLIGETKPELDGSAFAWFIHQNLGGTPPEMNLAKEIKLANFLLEANENNLLTASQNIGEGGLLTTLVKSTLISNIGLNINLKNNSIQYLFSESPTRALLFTNQLSELETLLEKHQIPFDNIGSTTNQESLIIDNLFEVSINELKSSFENQYLNHLNV